ncbi:protein S40-1-like [Mercurialis annua]|uniref:protein S40-1-like n=1 Tax=Mercurialis annua TaxID=3986 RepID=UPI00215EBB95|nr:protein S40-1-like [Mercurialis annua]
MAEEFQESEVIFSDYHNDDKRILFWNEELATDLENSSRRGKKKKQKKSNFSSSSSSSSSIPVNIPSNVFRFSNGDELLFDDEDFDDEDEELVPPHVIIGRRIQGKMAFSVCTGNGRTLKGRDLSEVRNSILKLTGFLEA